MKAKEESEKAGLKFNIQKTRIMAPSPIISCQIDGRAGGGVGKETVTDLIILDSKTDEDDDCSHEIKRCLLLGRKSYDQSREDIKKHRHYSADKGLSRKAMVFPVDIWMW